jgi:hypothetical protein
MVKAARHAFDLTDDTAEPADIWLCEHTKQSDVGLVLELLEHDLIVRLRHRPGDKSDVTVKHRRSTSIEVPDGWGIDDGVNEFKFEGDWAGRNQQLSASVTQPADPSVFPLESPLVQDLFSQAQQDFASAVMAPSALALTSLEPLGPIHASRWELKKDDTGFDHKIVAEQWSVDDRGFLELSIRVDFDEAATSQKTFTTFVHDKGFGVLARQETKTAATLGYLATRPRP